MKSPVEVGRKSRTADAMFARIQCDHQFLIELSKDGTPLARAPHPPEGFAPAIEWLRFSAMRRGRLPPLLGSSNPCRIEPVWDPSAGEPFVRAFRASVDSASGPGEPFAADIPRTYFRRFAESASEPLVRDGKLAKGETFRYKVLAFPGQRRDEAPTPAERFSVEEVPRPLALLDRPLARFGRRSIAAGTPRDGEMPVFIPRGVLEEAVVLKREAGELETGGILIGHLHRDARIPDLFAEITALIPARGARAESARLTFTAETWTAVQDAIKIRARAEVMLGWLHTHPSRYWCKDCEPAKRARCRIACSFSFFSDTDLLLHTSVFPRAYSVALVLGDESTGDGEWKDSVALYGWHLGMVMSRGFNVLKG